MSFQVPSPVKNNSLDQHARIVPMKILALGLCRTGTASTRVALMQLGYAGVYHMKSLLASPSDCSTWLKATQAKYHKTGTFTLKDWDSVLGNCMATTDLPASAFALELIAAYPNAKVILNIRDVDKWHASVLGTVDAMVRSRTIRFLGKFSKDFGPLHRMFTRLWADLFHGDFALHGKAVYKNHRDDIRRIMADRPGDYLEFDVKQGWLPLCEFLGHEVPEQEFPNVNDSAEYNAKMSTMFFSRYGRPLINSAVRSFGLVVLTCVVMYVAVMLSRTGAGLGGSLMHWMAGMLGSWIA